MRLLLVRPETCVEESTTARNGSSYEDHIHLPPPAAERQLSVERKIWGCLAVCVPGKNVFTQLLKFIENFELWE